MKDVSINSNKALQTFSKPILFGVILGSCLIFLALIFFAIILSFGFINYKIVPATAGISIAIGSFFGGFIAAKKKGQNGLLVGAICGLILFLIFLLTSLIINNIAPNLNSLIKLIIFVSAAAIGGIFGVGSSNKRKIV